MTAESSESTPQSVVVPISGTNRGKTYPSFSNSIGMSDEAWFEHTLQMDRQGEEFVELGLRTAEQAEQARVERWSLDIVGQPFRMQEYEASLPPEQRTINLRATFLGHLLRSAKIFVGEKCHDNFMCKVHLKVYSWLATSVLKDLLTSPSRSVKEVRAVVELLQLNQEDLKLSALVTLQDGIDFFVQEDRRQKLASNIRGLPCDALITAILGKVDSEHVQLAWQRALERREADPEGAITVARTLVESVCKYILDQKKVEYDESADLPKLYSVVAREVRLAPEQQNEQMFKQTVGACCQVVLGVASIRNEHGDAHGKASSVSRIDTRYAELAVNLAGAMALFLMRTFEEKTKA